MNFRLTLVLAIIMVVIGTVVFYTQRTAPPTKPGPKEHPVLAKSPDALATISLQRDGKTLMEFKKTDEKWAMSQPVSAPVDTWKVDSVSDALRLLNYRDKFNPEATGDKSLDATGLQAPGSEVDFTDDKGNQHALYIGKRTSVGTRYVRLDKDSSIYEVDNVWFENLDKDPGEFRSKDILQIAADRIASIALQRADQSIELDKNDGKWTIVKPISTRANTTVADDMAGSLSSLHVESFTDITPQSAGLTPPLLTVVVTARQKASPTTQFTATAATQPQPPALTTTTLRFGNYADLTKTNVYVTISGSNEVDTISAETFKKFDKTLFAARDAAITPAAIDTATAVQVTSAVSSTDPAMPAKLILERQDNAWTIQSPKVSADSSAVTAMLAAIKNLRANKFVDAPGDLHAIGLDPPLKTIAVTLPGQAQRETILIGAPQKADPLTPVQRQGEPTVFLVQTKDLDAVTPSLLTLRDLNVCKIPADSIRSVTFRNVTLEHTGTKWTVNHRPADSDKITSLLRNLDPLTAVRWTSMPTTAYPATPDVLLDVVSEETATTQPTTLPTTPMGPQPVHQVHHTVWFYKPVVKSPTTAPATPGAWSAVAATDGNWTFQPNPALVDLLTKTSYEAPTTAPATSPATAPATAP